MNKSKRYSPEVRERAVRMVFEHEREHGSQWAAICSIAGKIGCTPETLRSWVRRAERDQGDAQGLTTSERERLKELERENRELRRANEILRKASAYFAQAELDRRREVMVAFIDEHKEAYRGRADLRGAADRPVDVLRAQGARARSDRLPPRAKRDETLRGEIQRVWNENFRSTARDKVWRQLQREGLRVARCTVERLMRDLGLRGVVRGRTFKTTIPDEHRIGRPDLVESRRSA